jgi:hypothetical protein
MAFKKGQSGNPSGRRKGVRNKRTTEYLSRAQRMIELIESHENFQNALDSLTPKELLMLHHELLEYVEPKLARTEHDHGEGQKVIITVKHSLPSAMQQPQQIEDADFKILSNE